MHFIQAVVVANSYKNAGRCLAVIDLQTSTLLRPVTDLEHHEVPTSHSMVLDRGALRRLEPGDFVLIPLMAQDTSYWQRENWFLSPQPPIKLIDGELGFLKDRANRMFQENSMLPDFLLENPDRYVTSEFANRLYPSLEIRTVYDLEIVERTKEFGKKQLRAHFKYKDQTFDFPYTGEQSQFVAGIRVNRAMVCLSLGEAYHLNHYKLVAGIIKLSDR